MLKIFVSLVLTVMLGGGVSLAANHALPGDVLYPFKISVNERVEEVLTSTGDARIDGHVLAMERRLEEATALATKGRLDTQTQAQLIENFTLHARTVEGAIATLQTTGQTNKAAELATTFQATLVRQAETLTDTSIKSPTPVQTSLASVLAGVQQALSAASAASAKASAEAVVE